MPRHPCSPDSLPRCRRLEELAAKLETVRLEIEAEYVSWDWTRDRRREVVMMEAIHALARGVRLLQEAAQIP